MNGAFSWNGKTLLSGIDPAGRADRVAEAVSVMDRTLYLCPSPLYGYGLERLLARLAHTPNSAVLCIEADPQLFALSQEHFSAALTGHPQLRLTNCCETGALCALLRQEWGPRFFRRVQTLRLNGGWQLFPALYDTLAEALRHEIAIDWGNAITLSRLGRRYIRNAIRNLALIPRCPPLSELSFGSDPVLVLGAGPSLDALLDALPRHFGKFHLPENRPFRIICVDTCLPALRERGITPDLAVILESQHWNLADFIGLSGWKVAALMDLSALPRSGAVLDGGLFLFFTPWTELAIFKRLAAADLLPPGQPPLGSVGLSAVSIARLLTAGTIITAGLDFSFTLDSYHARSTPGHLARLRSHNRFTGLLHAQTAFGGAAFGAVSKNGTPVFSNPSMRKYRSLFEREFASVPGIFDLGGSGLPLGVQTLSPEAAFDLLSDDAKDRKGNLELKTSCPPCSPCLCERSSGILQKFMRDEQDRLLLLRNMLSGEIPMDYDALLALIDECDYLWAHFPDYAASDRHPGKSEMEAGAPAAISFLKRLRVEIDPFLKLWDLSCGLLESPL